jgi:eukaryotic-like serine/threonine-protein kinase
MDPTTAPHDTAPSGGRLDAGAGAAARYEILCEVGRGNMGVVYRARHKTLDRHVAIKVNLPGTSTERFLREARLLAQISSPHVVIVHDCDVLSDNSPVLVMEWVEGRTLQDVIRTHAGSLPEKQVVPWMRQVCLGMLAAAELGIIHRDLKPSNILIDDDGDAKVLDFGLARGPARPDDPALSRLGVMGTPYYMAPEQAEDPRGVDTRADVYSFGSTFYHALTGVPPFDGVTDFAVMFKHKTEPLAAPRSRNPHLSEHLSELLERCLAKSPSDRFQSFAEVERQLRPAAVTSPWEASDDELALYLTKYHERRDLYLDGRSGFRDTDAYEFPGGRVLKVLCGNIVDQKVDAVVSSDDEDLTMGSGVSASIRTAAGPRMVEEARRMIPVRVGRAAVTSAGDLPARFVIHGITLGSSRTPRTTPSRDLISEILTSCFYHADTLHVRSIALPLLGTGNGGFSQPVCLDTMFRFLARTLLRGLTSVREARIVLFCA